MVKTVETFKVTCLCIRHGGAYFLHINLPQPASDFSGFGSGSTVHSYQF